MFDYLLSGTKCIYVILWQNCSIKSTCQLHTRTPNKGEAEELTNRITLEFL